MLKNVVFFLNTDANCDIYLLFTVNENNLNATMVNCAYINMFVIYNFFLILLYYVPLLFKQNIFLLILIKMVIKP